MLACLALLFVGCPGPDPSKDTDPEDADADTDTDADADTDTDTDTDTDVDRICPDPVPPSCIDDMILDLSLQDDETSDGEVSNQTDGDDFVTFVDASAGGMNQASRNPWVYVKFTPSGAERVDIDDETALEDMNWHLSMRRFILRLNSGDSGPSCVGGEKQRGAYADLTEIPADVDFAIENFYDDECVIIEDNSGLPGSVSVVLGDWWNYGSCLETTDAAYLLQLDDGSVIKLTVESYYEGDGQEECNDAGSTTAESAMYTLRWQYLSHG